MNELRFLKAMGKIDEDILKEAEVDIEKKYRSKPSISKRKIYAFGSVAAAAVVTVGSVAAYNSHNPSDLLVDHSIIQQDIFGKNDDSNNNGVPLATDNNDPTEKSTLNEDNIQQTDPMNTQDTSISDDSFMQTTTVNNSNEPNNYDVPSATDYDELTESSTLNEDNIQHTDSINPQATSVNDDSLIQTTTVNSSNDPSPNDNKTPQITEPQNNGNKGGVSAENCYVQPFIATIDSDFDDYGVDELHHIDVRTADGFYRQLRSDEYDANGISSTISISDFGGYIGRIVEVSDYDYHGNQVESQEPAITGADVYYYAPMGNNKVFIIVKNGDQCSIFISDNINISSGFQNGFAFFDVNSADDIQMIDYHVDVPDDSGRMITSVQKTITDTETIRIFYELICRLQPEDYSSLPEHIATPQWLVDAWANYDADPDAPAREDYGIIIKLKDGTVLQDINYQPYLGNGYIEGMQELTPEQNTALRELLE